MGKLLPHFRNATYSGAGALNPLMNDPDYETIGIGTHIFLGGGDGYVIGEGTQHDPEKKMGTIMVQGDCKKMTPEFVRGASYTKYGTTLYLGIGIPIPVLNEGIVKKVAIRDEEIFTDVIDYGAPRRDRPKLRKVNYEELKSGKIVINDNTVKVSSLSSLKKARLIAEKLKDWIQMGRFHLSVPVKTLPVDTSFKAAKQTQEIKFVGGITKEAVTCREDEEINGVARRIVSKSVNHIVVVDSESKLRGIVTSWDITKAVAEKKQRLSEILVRRVVTTTLDDPLEGASRKMAQNKISALPVIDRNRKVIGIVTAEHISKLLRS